jgi:hypothetical protein
MGLRSAVPKALPQLLLCARGAVSLCRRAHAQFRAPQCTRLTLGLGGAFHPFRPHRACARLRLRSAAEPCRVDADARSIPAASSPWIGTVRHNRNGLCAWASHTLSRGLAPMDHRLLARACWAAQIQGEMRAYCRAVLQAVLSITPTLTEPRASSAAAPWA